MAYLAFMVSSDKKVSLLNYVPFVPTCLPCLCALRAYVPSCLKLIGAYVP